MSLRSVSFTLSVSNNPNLVSAVILSVVMLNVVVPNNYATYGASSRLSPRVERAISRS
jgi:hypothetical protein